MIGKPADESSDQIGMFLSGLTQGLDVPGFPGLASRGGIQFNARTLKRLQDTYYQLEEWGTELEELKYNIKKTEAAIKSETKQTGDNILALANMQNFNADEVRKKGKMLDVAKSIYHRIICGE